MARKETLYLLDGMALAYRAYFAFISRPLINSKGMNTGAIYGFVTTLMRILQDERPDHVAVVFDTKEPTFRHEKYPEYKATRQKMPEDMAAQLGRLKEVVRAFNTPLLEMPGFEADDIIGTLARRAEREGVITFMVTADKDYMQLISPVIKMYKPGKAGADPEIVTETGVREKFGVEPERVVEVLALTGDSSDNIPGVPGIGEKTAIPLIQKYGSLDGLYKRVEEIPQKGVREKLLKNRETAYLSRELVTIDTNVPVALDFHELRSAPPDRERLIALFADLEFRTLLERFKGKAAPAPAVDAAAATEPGTPETPPAAPSALSDIASDQHEYLTVLTRQELENLAAALRTASHFVFDTETTSTDPLQAELLGLSFCARERTAYYVPVSAPRPAPVEGLFAGAQGNGAESDHTAGALDRELVLKTLRPLFESEEVTKAGQNAKYDILVLRKHGIDVRGLVYDTMVASYILRADGQHNLDALAAETLNYRMIPFEELVGKGKNQKPLRSVPLEAVARYSAEDADMTMRIASRQVERLRGMDLLRLCETVEFPLIEVLSDMEFAGIALNVGYLASMSKDLERQLEGLVRDIHALAGRVFNINSTQQLREILFNELKLPPVRKTKTGYSTDVVVLEALRGQHPIIDRILEYRQLAKLKSTYVDALPSLIHPETGRVHTSFNQTVAATGRLSSSDPNLQNIPIRTEIGKAIRAAFVPGQKGSVLLSADYSQIELRVMAHISADEAMIEAFRNDEDIHATTAARVFGVGRHEVTKEMRRKAKEVNFGIMYGIGPFGLGNRLEIPQSEARAIIDRYFERFPGVKRYITGTIEGARQRGYVSTLLGRRRYLADIGSRNQAVRGNAERQAINMPIQGTSADMIKMAMIALHRAIRERGLRSRMLLQVHDELVFEVPEEEREMMRGLVIDRMQNAMMLEVPLRVDVGFGRTWLEAHP
jgi:DNA polymerase-1